MTPNHAEVAKKLMGFYDYWYGHKEAKQRTIEATTKALSLAYSQGVLDSAKVAEGIGNKAFEIAKQATILKSQNTEKGIAIAGEMIAKCIRKLGAKNV